MRATLLLLLVLPSACSDYDLTGKDRRGSDQDDQDSGEPDQEDSDAPPDSACSTTNFPVEDVSLTDACDEYEISGFTPVVEWEVSGENSTALPVVADLDRDGMPEIIANWSFFVGPGTMAVYRGDGSGLVWENEDADLGYGAAPAVADLDDDGWPEILGVRDLGGMKYAVVAWSGEGDELWQSEEFTNDNFDYASGVSVSDMDHDGSPEVVAGNVILHADGTTRAEGRFGSGCPALIEGSTSAVVDLDLDGIEEVVTGNTIYDPDGQDIWKGTDGDGAVAIGNFDEDPEGEFAVVAGNTIRAHDTDGTVLWGELTNPTANIFPVPAIGDVDNDGKAEIVVAGGDELWVLNAEDGSELWTARVHDMSGATGASLFDFDADGVLEVVYVDEVQVVAYNGVDGVVKFQTNEHASNTMYDYPVIADVDADGHAEIVVSHMGYGSGFSVYGDVNDSWAPARQLWNQHAYSITNINDDLSVPTEATPNFTIYNNWHAAQAVPPGAVIGDELQSEILEICEDDCDEGTLWVTARMLNAGSEEVPAGLSLALYKRTGDGPVLLDTATTSSATPSGKTTEALVFSVAAADVADADALFVQADDNGTGTGAFTECVEANNESLTQGEWCR